MSLLFSKHLTRCALIDRCWKFCVLGFRPNGIHVANNPQSSLPPALVIYKQSKDGYYCFIIKESWTHSHIHMLTLHCCCYNSVVSITTVNYICSLLVISSSVSACLRSLHCKRIDLIPFNWGNCAFNKFCAKLTCTSDNLLSILMSSTSLFFFYLGGIGWYAVPISVHHQ